MVGQCASPSPEYYRGISPYSPEMFAHFHRQGSFEYVGVPLEPPTTPYHFQDRDFEDQEHNGPSTADIIANQSQDYVDEKLAEYQATIQQLQGEFVSIIKSLKNNLNLFLL